MDGIIYFSVQFCDNSLLVLKMRSQVFSFASKKIQAFSRDRKVLMSLLSVLFHLQSCVSVFLNFNFSQDIWGNVHVPEINLISQGTLIKAFYLPRKTMQKKFERWFCRRKTEEDYNTKISVSSNMPCTFLLFKASAIFQIFFPRNLFFRQVLRTSDFLNSKCLTFVYLLIYLFLH